MRGGEGSTFPRPKGGCGRTCSKQRSQVGGGAPKSNHNSSLLGKALLNGFGWRPVFENDEIILYQMNGFVLGTWLTLALEEDIGRGGLTRPGAFALAHNVATQDEVQPLLDKLVSAGGSMLRIADAPVHGGFRGYVADPDDHGWEIAWNPAWSIDEGWPRPIFHLIS